jgi:quercetin dioxygenase-like cupin family protein
MNTCRVDFAGLPWISPAPGVRYKVYKQGNRQLRLVEFSEGFVEPDWCTKGHIGYVLAGSMELQFPDQTVTFGPGDGVFIPAGQDCKHKGRVKSGVFRVVLVEEA